VADKFAEFIQHLHVARTKRSESYFASDKVYLLLDAYEELKRQTLVINPRFIEELRTAVSLIYPYGQLMNQVADLLEGRLPTRADGVTDKDPSSQAPNSNGH
jgi:hypothetical protein